MTPEGKVKADIKRYLDLIGAQVFMPVQTGYGKTAVDFICCIRGRYVAIEAKKPGITKGTAAQENFLQEVRNKGGIGFVADSVETVKAMLPRDVHDQSIPRV